MTKRAWQRMISGRRLDLLDPSPMDIEINDIAHGLSFLARWNGQTKGDRPYSVAAHSLFVERIFSEMNPKIETRWQLAALLHDAAEYVLGDMISPAKAALGKGFDELEERIQSMIFVKYGIGASLPAPIKAKIKAADLASAYLEARDLAGFAPKELTKYFKKPRNKALLVLSPEPLRAKDARLAFLARFHELDKMLGKGS